MSKKKKQKNKQKNKQKQKQNIYITKMKSAPYTILMILALIGFWGYKAVYAINEQGGNAVSENVSVQNGVYPETVKNVEIIDPAWDKTGPADPDNGSSQPVGDTVTADPYAEDKDQENAGEGLTEETESNSAANAPAGSENGGGTGADTSAQDADGEDDTGSDPAAGEEESGDGAASWEERYALLTEEELAAYPFSMGELEGNYICYKPKNIESRYYSDRGKLALDTPADYVTVGDEYFDDACFVGDSRMVGIYDYSGWDNADFYCDNGYCVYYFKSGKSVICQNNGKKYTLEDGMDRKKYGKIYIMIGTNDCGYGNTDDFKNNYSEMLDMIREKQPDALIFLIANLRVSAKAEKEDKTGVYNNIDINDKNAAISELADGESVFFFDCNPPFVNEKGYLIEDNTFDGFHVYARQYVEMSELFKAHGIIKKDR